LEAFSQHFNMGSVSPEKSNLDNCSYWCTTDGDKIERGVGSVGKTTFVWRVKNFSARPEQKGQFITSDSFTVLSPNGVVTKWVLQLFPKSVAFDQDGKFVVFLRVLETKARASYQILISGKNGMEMYVLGNSYGRVFKPEPKQAWVCRCSRDALSEWWLFDDVLTLVCEITVHETFYDIQQNHRLQMMDDLEKAYKEKDFYDVTVNCKEGSFACNKLMLTARSPVFKSMFQHDTKENKTNVVNLKDIEPKILEEMLRYIHTGETTNIRHTAKKLLAAADFYQLDQLKTSCQEILSETLDAENSIELLILGDLYSASKLRKNALKFVSENMTTVFSSCDWKEMLAGYPHLQSEIIESLMEVLSMYDTLGGDLKRALKLK